MNTESEFHAERLTDSLLGSLILLVIGVIGVAGLAFLVYVYW